MFRAGFMTLIIAMFTISFCSQTFGQSTIANYQFSTTSFTIGLNKTAISPTLYFGDGNSFQNMIGDLISISPSNTQQIFTIQSNSDDPDYSAFINNLTNGTTQEMWAPTLLATTRAGLFVTGTDSSFFGTSPDLVGNSIDSMKLTVEPFAITHPNSSSTQVSGINGNPFGYNWEVISLPEPSSCAIFMMGFSYLIHRKIR